MDGLLMKESSIHGGQISKDTLKLDLLLTGKDINDDLQCNW